MSFPETVKANIGAVIQTTKDTFRDARDGIAMLVIPFNKLKKIVNDKRKSIKKNR